MVVSSFPPMQDGIGIHARQLAAHLERDRPVLRISVPGGHGDHVVRLAGGLRPLKLLWLTRPGDRLLLMWHPGYYIGGRRWSLIAGWLALYAVFKRRSTELHHHEPVGPPSQGRGWKGVLERIEAAVQKRALLAPDEFVFHSEWEAEQFRKRFPGSAGRHRVIGLGASYKPAGKASKPAARAALGLVPEVPIFVCIGFFGWHKGFDRAVRAFAEVPLGPSRLYVVGSVPEGANEDVLAFAAELRAICGATPGVVLREGFVSDAEFDLWLQAADAVVVPYRGGVNSAVTARAKLLGARVVATRIGGVPEQLLDEDLLVDDDGQLAEALGRLAVEAGGEAQTRSEKLRSKRLKSI